MFANLDKVPWHTIRHAYGPANDTPIHLRNLVSDDPEQREQAFEELMVTIYHQGAIYPAAIAAVPFLIEILQTPTIPEKQYPLELL